MLGSSLSLRSFSRAGSCMSLYGVALVQGSRLRNSRHSNRSFNRFLQVSTFVTYVLSLLGPLRGADFFRAFGGPFSAISKLNFESEYLFKAFFDSILFSLSDVCHSRLCDSLNTCLLRNLSKHLMNSTGGRTRFSDFIEASRVKKEQE